MPDIHPLVVHFPVAFMTTYALTELIRFKRVRYQAWWFYVQALTAIAGAVFGFVTLQTGEIAEQNDAVKNFGAVVEVHSFWATTSTILLTVAAVLYLVAWLKRTEKFEQWVEKKSTINKVWTLICKVQQVFFRPWFLTILGIAALVSITITGALGGSLVYGPEADPVVSFIYHLFFKS